MTRTFNSAAALADAIIETVGKTIVLGLPVGIGKASHVADALLERAEADASISLTIFTGLTLETPRAKNDLARRLLDPIAERMYSGWPTPAYADAVRCDALPANVQVREFYLRPGAYLDNSLAQRSYASINYSHVVSELQSLGLNVIVSCRPESPEHFSLSSNPDLTLDLLPYFAELRRHGSPCAMIGQVNRRLPYMLGDAELPATELDFVLDADEYAFPPFALPSRRVSSADYATAMHVASLVRDGGTLQLGISSLADAIAHCLMLRHEHPELFEHVLAQLPGGTGSERRAALPVERGRFEQGLFASTELMSDAVFALFEAGIVRRAADADDEAAIHAGFFLGSARLYEGLAELDEHQRRRINMTRISYVNTLLGDEARKRRQRRDARFINETMMVTLLGAAVSDALEDGRVVSGVGGQFDFVSMAHTLEGAQSILMCRARRLHAGVAQSNVHWTYAHTTVPRHYRDVFVTEYGIAATRGRTDAQVIDALLCVADSAFQPQLLEAANEAGKLAASYELPADARRNTPAALQAVFEDDDVAAHFPPYPLGSAFTPIEQKLSEALQWLEARTAQPWPRARTIAAAIMQPIRVEHDEAFARMRLDRPRGLGERLSRRLLGLALGR
jgi:acyl-CoA hydrolase